MGRPALARPTPTSRSSVSWAVPVTWSPMARSGRSTAARSTGAAPPVVTRTTSQRVAAHRPGSRPPVSRTPSDSRSIAPTVRSWPPKVSGRKVTLCVGLSSSADRKPSRTVASALVSSSPRSLVEVTATTARAAGGRASTAALTAAVAASMRSPAAKTGRATASATPTASRIQEAGRWRTPAQARPSSTRIGCGASLGMHRPVRTDRARHYPRTGQHHLISSTS